jgi:hypothetical protein
MVRRPLMTGPANRSAICHVAGGDPVARAELDRPTDPIDATQPPGVHGEPVRRAGQADFRHRALRRRAASAVRACGRADRSGGETATFPLRFFHRDDGGKNRWVFRIATS